MTSESERKSIRNMSTEELVADINRVNAEEKPRRDYYAKLKQWYELSEELAKLSEDDKEMASSWAWATHGEWDRAMDQGRKLGLRSGGI